MDSSGRLITVTAPSPVDWTTPASLIEIDPLSGVGTEIAIVSDLVNAIGALAFSPDDELFAYSRVAGGVNGGGGLYKIDVETGHAQFIGPTQLDGGRSGFFNALTFAPNGILYGWSLYGGSYSVLYTIDPNTGITTDVNPSVSGSGDIQTLEFGPDGLLYGARLDLFRIDPITGVAVNIGGNFIGDVRGLAAPDSVPIPSAVWLLGSAIACIVGIKGKNHKQQHPNKP